jgi:hypothetical protein
METTTITGVMNLGPLFKNLVNHTSQPICFPEGTQIRAHLRREINSFSTELQYIEIIPLQQQIWNYMEPLLQEDKPFTPFLSHMDMIIEKYESAPFIVFKVANYYSCPPEISNDDLNMLYRIRDCDYHQDLSTRLNLISIWNIFNRNVLNDLLLFFEPNGKQYRDIKSKNLEIRNGTMFSRQLKLYDDEIEVIKLNSNVEKVQKEVSIIREAQCNLIKHFVMNIDYSTIKMVIDDSDKYSPWLIASIVLVSVFGVIIIGFAVKMTNDYFIFVC